jgi:mono/diheme cytochrome c family protein
MVRRGVLTITIFFWSLGVGCGRDRTSGAATPDTSQVSVSDTASSRDSLTTSSRADSTPPRSDSMPARSDTTASKASPPAAMKPKPKPASTKPAVTPTHPASPDTTPAQAAQPTDTATATPTQTAEASAPLRDEYHQAPLDTVSQDVYNGWKQFNLNCARCHGEDVQGTTIAPHLIVSLRSDGPINTKELFVQTVCAGRPEKGMPSWCALGMDMGKINQIYAYVKGRSDAQIHPGRPALKSGG